jgi:hypothetical protein
MPRYAVLVLMLALALGPAVAVVGCAKKAPADAPKGVEDANAKAKAAIAGAPVADKKAPPAGGK